MATSVLTIEEIYQYFKEKGNVVKNRELVHQFKHYLIDPASKDDARIKFKKYVNTLAQTRTENGEKYLFLKTKYITTLDLSKTSAVTSPIHHQVQRQDSTISLGIPHSLSASHLQTDSSSSSSSISSRSPALKQPPPYRPPPPVTSSPSPSLDNISLSSMMSQQDLTLTPQAPPRRKSVDRVKSIGDELSSSGPKFRGLEGDDVSECEGEGEEKQSVSVKERTQKFNRMASVEDELNTSSPRQQKMDRSRSEKGVPQDDDGASVTSLEPKKCMEWYVTASKGDLQELVKLAKDEPRLVNRKDPFTATVLHWGAKHGNAEIIKVFAGNYKVDVNGRTNGGYTPLHLAAQFGHRNIFKLLIEVYKADVKIRDYSGRFPDYYLLAKEQKGRKDNIRKIKGRKKQSEKDLGFLRIGSLNVRVKKTTEAFSNFLGVGGGGSVVNPADSMTDKVHKGWGSADNVNQDARDSRGNAVKKKSKRPLDSGLNSSTPNTPVQASKINHSVNDSDSDTAAGFDSQWNKN